MTDYLFFFSYARANHENAQWTHHPKIGNHLDEFFAELCRRISDLTGKPANEVGYRDRERLRVADFWNRQLVDALQASRVLLAFISPHYLSSINCGREVELFKRRLEALESSSGQRQQSHRIIPIFWIDAPTCLRNVHREITKLITDLQFSHAKLPENYLTAGAAQICRLRADDTYDRLCDQISRRIVELADMPLLPKLPGQADFSELPSAFPCDKEESGASSVADGPAGTNVVYIVGTQHEMVEAGCADLATYGNNRGAWKPFAEAPGASVEMATQEGLNMVGQNEYRNLELPNNLLGMIEEAKQRNSPVLMVLDRNALRVLDIEEKMRAYDGRNYSHVGLVTAGGAEVGDEALAEICQHKFASQQPLHIWTLPDGRSTYVASVAEVMSGLKQRLLRTGQPTAFLRASSMPGLAGPSGG